MTSTEVVADHRAAGRAFTAAGMTGFVREAGDGRTVLCVHGVPASSFLYRKVLNELAARDLRGGAFDLPGLGLADRPENFDRARRLLHNAIDARAVCRTPVPPAVRFTGRPWARCPAPAVPTRRDPSAARRSAHDALAAIDDL